MQKSFLDIACECRRSFGHGKKQQSEIGLHSQATLGDLWTRFEEMINNVRSVVVLHAAFLSCHAMFLVTQCSPTQECCMMRMHRNACCTG